jgi:hypothetical protein
MQHGLTALLSTRPASTPCWLAVLLLLLLLVLLSTQLTDDWPAQLESARLVQH